MVRHLGFEIPLGITNSQGARLRLPTPGMCAECEKPRIRVYVRGDNTRYCVNCIEFDIAEADPSDEVKREQRHPELHPTEPFLIPQSPIPSVIEDAFK